MLAIFWSWTCVEKPELCGRGDKKQVRTLIFYLITCGCKLSLLWVLQPLYVKLVIWQDNLQIFWLDLTYTYLNLSNVLSLQIWPMNRWEITAHLFCCCRTTVLVITVSMSICTQVLFAYTAFCLTCEVAEDTEGEGEAGGVSRLQGRLRVT